VKVLSVIPARGGSKGIPKKNLLKFFDISLVGWAAKTSADCSEITNTVVSTDDVSIAADAEKFGAAFLGPRPSDLSSDTSPDQPVLKFEIERAELQFKITYDLIVMLQPTSPLRTPEDIRICLQKMQGHDASSVWTISPIDKHSHFKKQFTMSKDGLIESVHKGREVQRRQDLEETFRRNGAVYIFTRETVFSDPNLRGDRCLGVLLSHSTVNIDSMADFEQAKSFVRLVDNKMKFLHREFE
jgi:CMP-N-acetylneuraminic acid synthetase